MLTKSRLFLLLLLVAAQINFSFGQSSVDSFIKKYTALSDLKKQERSLEAYLWYIVNEADNKQTQLSKLLSYFQENKDEIGVGYTKNMIAYSLAMAGDYNAGITMSLAVLQQFEKNKNLFGIRQSYNILGLCYGFAQNYEQGVLYFKKIIPIDVASGSKVDLSAVYNNIGSQYASALIGDSGLIYAQKAVSIDTELGDTTQLLLYSLTTLAENYIAKKDYDIALPYLLKSFRYIIKTNQEGLGGAFVANDLAQAFLNIKMYDSSILYATTAMLWSSVFNSFDQKIRACEYLYKNYKAVSKTDSAFKYLQIATATKDSLYSKSKLELNQAITFKEDIRQKEWLAEQHKIAEERSYNIQLFLLACGIITLIVLFFLLSRSIITNPKIIELLGVVGLLVLFEFINLLIHPFLERVTHHNLILMLLALVALAFVLVPLHHKIEKWVTHKLIEKNKKIRLAQAKKTIEKLEQE